MDVAILMAANLLEVVSKRRSKNEAYSRLCVPMKPADQCELGPVVVIYPQGIWYGGVTTKDVTRIVEETIIGGRIIGELLIADQHLNTKGKHFIAEEQ